MSNKTTFFIKRKSIREFFLRSGTVNNLVESFSSDPVRQCSRKIELEKEILLRKDALPKEIQYVVIEFDDQAVQSEAKLLSQYSYEVQAYDDVSIVLILIGIDTNPVTEHEVKN